MHRYSGVTPTGELEVNGSHLRSRFDFKRVREALGFTMVHEGSAITDVHGLGYSMVTIYEKTVDMHSRLRVLPTPIDEAEIEMTLVSRSPPDMVKRPIPS